MPNPPDHPMREACESGIPLQRRRLRWLRWLLFALLLVAAGWGVLVVSMRYYMSMQYPYGYSHCCDIGMGGVLREYASEHNGKFPAGEATPEASLSLLYPKHADADSAHSHSGP
jgi:hypothetical protein